MERKYGTAIFYLYITKPSANRKISFFIMLSAVSQFLKFLHSKNDASSVLGNVLFETRRYSARVVGLFLKGR